MHTFQPELRIQTDHGNKLCYVFSQCIICKVALQQHNTEKFNMLRFDLGLFVCHRELGKFIMLDSNWVTLYCMCLFYLSP